MISSAGLYVHIPFCASKCHYCDFTIFVGQDKRKDEYLTALAKEASEFQNTQLETLYIGGGTPTVLSPSQIRRLISQLRAVFDCSLLGEATVEANPESATSDVLQSYYDQGLNRLSLGFQATQEHLLQSLNRHHRYQDEVEAFERARKIGFKNVNVDLMFGLPGQTSRDWIAALREVLAMDPDHVSLYALKIETGTKFSRIQVEVDDDREADMYLCGSEELAQRGFNHYEISNFARPGKESAHNLRYWQNKNVLGLGVGAAGFFNGWRKKNTSHLMDYLKGIAQSKPVAVENCQLTPDQLAKETLMLGLRLKIGVLSKELEKYSLPHLRSFLQMGLAVEEAGRTRLTTKGWLLSNQMFSDFV